MNRNQSPAELDRPVEKSVIVEDQLAPGELKQQRIDTAEEEYLKSTTEAREELEKDLAAAAGENPTAEAMAEFDRDKSLANERYQAASDDAWDKCSLERAEAKIEFDREYQASWDEYEATKPEPSQPGKVEFLDHNVDHSPTKAIRQTQLAGA